MVLLLLGLFRAGFEPLSWRGDHGSFAKNWPFVNKLDVVRYSLSISQPTPRLKTGADWRGKGTEPWARRVFRPTETSPYRP
jgi:hypothetical protein